MIQETATRHCHRCQADTNQVLLRNIAANGSVQVGYNCTKCRSWVKHGKGIWITHKELDNDWIDPAKLPVFGRDRPPPTCSRCGTLHAELHHWAPQSLFFDADAWPTDYLCRPCHERWHKEVTPKIYEKMKVYQ